MASVAFFNFLPRPTKIESGSVVIAALLSPFWFFNIGGVNIDPADLILLFVSMSFFIRTGYFPYSLSKKTGIAIFVFLLIVGLSTLWSSNRLEGLASFVQYLFIFIAVVPIVSYSLRDRFVRWRVFLAIWATTSGLSVLGIFTYVSGDVSNLRNLTLWYGNQNQFYWLVVSSLLCSIALVVDNSLPVEVRLGSAFLVIIKSYLIVEGKTLSAYLMLGAGIWLFVAWLAQQESIRVKRVFAIATAFTGVIGFVFIIMYWDWIYLQGSLDVRIRQYTNAVRIGIQYFPLGVGIDAHPPSVHNAYLDYFVEIGIAGAGAFLVLVIVWCRDVLLRSLYYPARLESFEYAFIVVFGTYILVIMFQPIPVRRFWWILFGASWAVVNDRLVTPISET